MRFFRDAFLAIFKPVQYKRLLNNSMANTIGYVFWLVFMSVLISTLVVLSLFFIRYKSVASFINSNVPEFHIDSTGFTIDEKLEINDVVYIYADSDKLSEQAKEIAVDDAILLYKDALILRNAGRDNKFAYSDIKEFGDGFDKDKLLRYVPVILGIGVAAIVFVQMIVYISEVISYIFMALMIAVLSIFIAKMNGMRLSFGNIFKLSLYAGTMSFVLSKFIHICIIIAINIVGLSMNGELPWWISVLFTLIYMYVAIDGINKDRDTVEAERVYSDENFGKVVYEDNTYTAINEVEQDDVYNEPKEEIKPERIIPSDTWSFGTKEDSESNE